jgi:hypothetical protein
VQCYKTRRGPRGRDEGGYGRRRVSVSRAVEADLYRLGKMTLEGIGVEGVAPHGATGLQQSRCKGTDGAEQLLERGRKKTPLGHELA